MPAVLLVLAGCSDGATAPANLDLVPEAAVVMDAQWVPLSLTVDNTCVGETMAVTGRAHITTRIFDDGSGLRVKGHTNLNLEGVGLLTGIRYQFQQLTNSDFEEDLASGSTETAQVFHLNVISSSAAPNSLATMNGTTVITAGGGSQLFAKRWTFFCR
jgi:hypothetical protein